ncbi:MAG: hypothetical protein GAK34_00647 [Delftia tsuruhatensis]|nr:MAG: hypothetical protein GAK34_00647 [Delftia tsuruhatensis]
MDPIAHAQLQAGRTGHRCQIDGGAKLLRNLSGAAAQLYARLRGIGVLQSKHLPVAGNNGQRHERAVGICHLHIGQIGRLANHHGLRIGGQATERWRLPTEIQTQQNRIVVAGTIGRRRIEAGLLVQRLVLEVVVQDFRLLGIDGPLDRAPHARLQAGTYQHMVQRAPHSIERIGQALRHLGVAAILQRLDGVLLRVRIEIPDQHHMRAGRACGPGCQPAAQLLGRLHTRGVVGALAAKRVCIARAAEHAALGFEVIHHQRELLRAAAYRKSLCNRYACAAYAWVEGVVGGDAGCRCAAHRRDTIAAIEDGNGDRIRASTRHRT